MIKNYIVGFVTLVTLLITAMLLIQQASPGDRVPLNTARKACATLGLHPVALHRRSCWCGGNGTTRQILFNND